MTDELMKHLQEKIKALDIDNVVLGDLPSRQLDCVALRPVDGYNSTRYFATKTLTEPLLEVLIRNTDYLQGSVWYNVIAKNLDKYVNKDEGIEGCWLTGSPGYLGADENGFGEWHMIFHLTISEGSDLNG